jgi:hypothetical protein
MDRVPSPGDDLDEVPETDRVSFNDFKIVEVTDDCFRQFGQARGFTARADLDDVEGVGSDGPTLPAQSPTLEGRPDIDTAMVDALRHAMVSDHGPAARMWETPDTTFFDDAGRAPDLGVLTGGAATPPRRCDIDTAMVEALRSARASDREAPDA